MFFACMTTSIGLTTSFADYFHELFPNMSYKKITAIVCLFSFVISNIGLDMLVQVSLPVLMMIYPVTVVLVILVVFQEVDWKSKDGICTGNAVCVLCCFCRRDAKCENLCLESCYRILPASCRFMILRLGWIIPAVAGALVGTAADMEI